MLYFKLSSPSTVSREPGRPLSQVSIWRGLGMRFCVISFLSLFASVTFASSKIEFMSSFANWELKRKEFLKDLKPVKLCYTEEMASKIMKVINSNQCTSIPLPLDDAIQIEYDNWVSEDWFPDEQELEEMLLDEIM